LRDKLGFLSRCADEYGDVVKLKIGEPTFLLNNPEDIKHLLVVNPDNYVKSPRMTSSNGKRLSGAGLLTSVGAVHLKQRRMMQPVFYRKTVESFSQTITDGIGTMLARWEDGVELDFGREMMGLVQRNIVKTVLGSDADEEMPALLDAITIRRLYMEHVFFSPFPGWMPSRIGWAYRQAMRCIDDCVYRAIRARRARPASEEDVLSLLLRAKYHDGNGMTNEQVRDEAVTLFVTGYETIGEALTWTSYLLSQHPAIEARFIAEVDDVLGGRLPTAEDLPRLAYTGMVFAESMRLYPPTWIFIRMALENDRLPSGATIPAGSKIYLCQYVMHRNPRYFTDLERFEPERFTETAKKGRPQFAYFPFGGGARVCIGEHFAKMEGILVLAAMAQRFKLTLVPGQTIVPEPKMTLRPKNGIMMRLHLRRQNEESQMVSNEPLVSVVIPTVNRPRLVVRAVRSALAQTFKPIEVIVVIDGPDEPTKEALAALNEPRLIVKPLPRNLGVAEARNAGVDAARGRWIAFLDDDDEWLPDKLNIQLRTARHSMFQDPIVACHLIKRSETIDVVLPRRWPAPDEPMSEYLFRRTRWFGVEGVVLSSAILTTKNLLQQVRFRAELRRHEDLDWLLRASRLSGAKLQFVATAEPLVIWNKEEQRETLSTSKDWRFSLSWIQHNRHLVTPRAYASFLLTWLSANAVQERDRSAFRPLLKEAFRQGAPSALDICVFFGIWLMPRRPRQCLSEIFTGRSRLKSSASTTEYPSSGPEQP
jgi:cytochrome P450/glycosyltransferase involved in cell wall biosynthesis